MKQGQETNAPSTWCLGTVTPATGGRLLFLSKHYRSLSTLHVAYIAESLLAPVSPLGRRAMLGRTLSAEPFISLTGRFAELGARCHPSLGHTLHHTPYTAYVLYSPIQHTPYTALYPIQPRLYGYTASTAKTL
jgi:hypothetical protein